MNRRQRLSIIVLVCTALFAGCRKKDSPATMRGPNPPESADTVPVNHPPEAPDTIALVQKAVHAIVDPNIGGFYEALPPDYDSTTRNYPLLLFLHGGGELGNGESDLPLVLKNSIPRLLLHKTFPLSFTVKGETFSFVVISPQFRAWPAPADVDAMIKYSIDHYRIDTKRLYIVGLSMGGGATWEYSGVHGREIAAIVPISGASWADSSVARGIALSDIPIWAFHNMDDSVVTVNSTTRYIRLINFYNPGLHPKMTIWPEGGHDAWTKASDPAYKEDDKNIYEWMLQYTR